MSFAYERIASTCMEVDWIAYIYILINEIYNPRPRPKSLAGLAEKNNAPRRSLGSPHLPAGVLCVMKSLGHWQVGLR